MGEENAIILIDKWIMNRLSKILNSYAQNKDNYSLVAEDAQLRFERLYP